MTHQALAPRLLNRPRHFARVGDEKSPSCVLSFSTTGGFTIRSGVPYQSDNRTIAPPKTSRGSTIVSEAHGLPRTHVPHGWMNNLYDPGPMDLAKGGHSTFGGTIGRYDWRGWEDPYDIGPGQNWKKAGGLGGGFCGPSGPIKCC